jgi:hypothetical protein
MEDRNLTVRDLCTGMFPAGAAAREEAERLLGAKPRMLMRRVQRPPTNVSTAFYCSRGRTGRRDRPETGRMYETEFLGGIKRIETRSRFQ